MKLATTTRGSGSRTAALVHGASMSGNVWDEFADLLIDDYDLTVITVDLRGHGESPRAASYHPGDFAADLVETLPAGLDFLVGQSLGGLSSALAAPEVGPGHFIGLDPAFDVSRFHGFLMRTLSPVQPRFPDRLLTLLDVPPAGAAPGMLQRYRDNWARWDPTMMRHLGRLGGSQFAAQPPAVPSTLVLAERRRFAVSVELAAELARLGWDVRVKPGGVHDLHTQDPRGLVALLDDVFRVPAG